MRIQLSGVLKALLIILIFMRLSYLKLFGQFIPVFSTSYDSFPLVTFYLVSIGFGLILVLGIKKRHIPMPMKVIIVLIIIICISSYFISTDKNQMTSMGALSYLVSYSLMFLAIPIYLLLVNGRWRFASMTNTIIALTLGSYVFRMLISAYWGLTGTLIFPNIAKESAIDNWVRNDILRINPPCFSLIFVPIAYYLLINSKKDKNKIWYGMCIAISIIYSNFLHGRSAMIYNVIVLIILYVFKKVNSRRKLVRFLVLFFILVLIINTPYFNELLDSFSNDGSALSGSTIVRKYAIEYFGEMYSKSPVFGFGFMNAENRVTPMGGALADIGFLGGVYTLGIPILLLYTIMLMRGLYVAWQARKTNSNESLLVFGMTILILLTGINIDCFFNVYAFAMPFYVAIVEYIHHIINNSERSRLK